MCVFFFFFKDFFHVTFLVCVVHCFCNNLEEHYCKRLYIEETF
jgi:hypothetical protein